MSGRALADRLGLERPGIPVLYTSGYTSGRFGGDDSLGIGAHFIPKPFSAEQLAGRIRDILDSRRARAA